MSLTVFKFADLDDADKEGLVKAFHAARKSADPRTKVGAYGERYNGDFRPVSNIEIFSAEGYNRFPVGVKEDERLNDRTVKNRLMIHAEIDLLENLRHSRYAPQTVWITKAPCVNCAKTLIHAQVDKVVFPWPDKSSSWYDEQQFALSLFRETSTYAIAVIINEGDV